MDNRKITGLVAIGLGAAAAVLITRELTGDSARRDRLSDTLHQGAGKIRKTSEELLHEGEEQVNTWRNNVNALRASMAKGVQPPRDENRARDFIDKHESAMVAFMTSVLVKGFSSYMQWRSLERARADSGNKHSTGSGGERAPADMTVAELRKEAAQQNIDGRSNMNKQELVSALEE